MNRLNKTLLIAFVIAGCCIAASAADAKSVTYSGVLPQISAMATAPAYLTNTQMSVLYSATVTNADTGTVMNDGDIAQIGAHLTVSPKLHDYSDVSWFTTGSSMDSPYGNWGASAPAATCNANDYVFESQVQRSYGPYSGRTYSKIYESALVQSPAQTITTSSNLSCSAPAGDGSETCTVQSAGPITVTVSFATTPGQFYGQETTRSIPDTQGNPTWGPTGCANFSQTYSGGGAVTFTVPQQDIPFSFTAPPPANRAPNAPALSCPASGTTGQSLSFSASGTDPDGNTVRYGIDWANNGSISEWAPSSGYVGSGTSQSFSHTFSSAGTYVLKALTQDDQGANSGWSATCSVTVSPPAAPTALLTATPTSVAYGGASTLQWSSSNATSCTGTNFNTGGAISGSVSTGALSGNQSYSVTCTGPGGSASNNANVTVGPAPQADLTAGSVAPSSATAGTPVTFTATASNIGTATSGSFPMLFDIQNVAQFNSAYGAGLTAGASQSMSSSYTFPSSGTYNVRACANLTSTFTPIVTESDYSNNCGPYTTVTVGAVPQADLSAGGVSPTTATAGTATTLSATISNGGSGSTGVGFTNLFQRATDSAGSNATDIGTAANAALGAGGSNSTGLSYTFSTSGTWYVRACADKSSAGNAGAIAESNENNNCGPWTSISVGAAPQFTLSCSVDNANPKVGDPVTYTALGGTAPWNWTASDGYPINGQNSTAIRTFSSAGAFGMQVGSFGYTTANCPVVTAGAAQCTNPSANITASPNRVRAGDPTTLSYRATGVDTGCTITGPGVNQAISPNSCNVAPNTLVTPGITAQSVYKITCDSGESVAQVIVNLIPKFTEF